MNRRELLTSLLAAAAGVAAGPPLLGDGPTFRGEPLLPFREWPRTNMGRFSSTIRVTLLGFYKGTISIS